MLFKKSTHKKMHILLLQGTLLLFKILPQMTSFDNSYQLFQNSIDSLMHSIFTCIYHQVSYSQESSNHWILNIRDVYSSNHPEQMASKWKHEQSKHKTSIFRSVLRFSACLQWQEANGQQMKISTPRTGCIWCICLRLPHLMVWWYFHWQPLWLTGKYWLKKCLEGRIFL